MFLETERLVLREFLPEDYDATHAYSSDYENVRHMMFGPNTPQQTWEFLNIQCVQEREESPRMHYNIALELKAEKKIIGGISLHLNWRRDDALLGIITNRHYSGCGYSAEGLQGVLRIAFEQLKLHRVHAVCDVQHLPIQQLLEKLGFRNEGLMRQRGKGRPEDPTPYFDQYGYAILASEWFNNQQ